VETAEVHGGSELRAPSISDYWTEEAEHSESGAPSTPDFARARAFRSVSIASSSSSSAHSSALDAEGTGRPESPFRRRPSYPHYPCESLKFLSIQRLVLRRVSLETPGNFVRWTAKDDWPVRFVVVKFSLSQLQLSTSTSPKQLFVLINFHVDSFPT
jgi:hypothetical protein